MSSKIICNNLFFVFCFLVFIIYFSYKIFKILKETKEENKIPLEFIETEIDKIDIKQLNSFKNNFSNRNKYFLIFDKKNNILQEFDYNTDSFVIKKFRKFNIDIPFNKNKYYKQELYLHQQKIDILLFY